MGFRANSRRGMIAGAILMFISATLFAVSVGLPWYYSITTFHTGIRIDPTLGAITVAGWFSVNYGVFEEHYHFVGTETIGGTIVSMDHSQTNFLDQNCQLSVNGNQEDPTLFRHSDCNQFNTFRVLTVFSAGLSLITAIFMLVGMWVNSGCLRTSAVVFGLLILSTGVTSMALWIDLIKNQDLTTTGDSDIHHYGISFWLHCAAVATTILSTLTFCFHH